MTSQSNDAHWQRSGESAEPIPGRPASARLVDPEDDLTPVGYPGDFGTTSVIPHRDLAASAGVAAGGYQLLDQQEPLPYVQPQSAAQTPAVVPGEIDADEDKGRVRAGAGGAPSTWVCWSCGWGSEWCWPPMGCKSCSAGRAARG